MRLALAKAPHPDSHLGVRPPAATTVTAGTPIHPMLRLQQRVGNRRMQRLLGSRAVQPKLIVNEPRDAYEQEADRIADAITSMPGPSAAASTTPSPPIQRACAACDEDEASSHVPQVMPQVQARIDSLRGGGTPLDSAARAFFEPRLGRDLGGVRLHTDATSTQALRARAYTIGRDIVFAPGQYEPAAPEGRRLLAHELTHVIQQQGGAARLIQRAETDTSKGCAHLADTKDDVNKRINQALASARKAAGPKPTAAAVIDGVFSDLGKNPLWPPGRTKIELWAEALGTGKVEQPAQAATKYAGVTFGLWGQPAFPILNPTMRVKNICIGSDKLGHFLQQGHDYFQITKQPGKTAAEAEKWGESTEAGGFGLATTGVFSNADLEANRQGLKFYQDLEANPSLTFDIANYINANWNEEVNPSQYEPSVGATVWSNLLTGTWSGSFTQGPAPYTIPVSVTLSVANDVNVTGTYSYTSLGGHNITGKILNGKVVHLTNTLGAITGVRIHFEWAEGTGSGKGFWVSSGEHKLQGMWGVGSSDRDGGDWTMTR